MGSKVRPKVPPASPPPAPPVSPPPTSPPPAAKLGSFGNASIDKWDDAFLDAVDAVWTKKKVGVSPLFLKAMMAVESGNDGTYPASRCRSDGSCGPMQIKPQYHQWRCRECDFTTVRGQVELAAHIIGDTMEELDTDEYGALLDAYFPTDDILNGTTQAQYVARVKDLVAQMGGTTPPPAPQRDVLDLLFGGKPYDVSAHYGQLVTWSCPNCYDYFTAYGLDSAHHWAYDAAAKAGDGAPLYAPFDGKVVCAGTGIGAGAWGTGCAAFERVNNYGGKSAGTGHGRLELLHAGGTKSLILGHALRSQVGAGAIVKTGDYIGQQGGMNGSHVHVEGRFSNGTRIGDPRVLFGGTGLPDAMGVPIAQPDDIPPYMVVRAKKKTPVLQRGNPQSPSILPDLQKGDEFHSQHQVVGADGRMYWVGRLLGRVAVADTEVVDTVLS